MTQVFYAVLVDHDDEAQDSFITKFAQSGRQAAFYGKQLLDKTMFAKTFTIRKQFIKTAHVADMLNNYIPKPVTGYTIENGWIKECH